MTKLSTETSGSRATKKPRTATRWFNSLARKPYTRGLPEWDLFPDEESRCEAIEEIESGMMPRSIGSAVSFLATVAVLFLGPYYAIGIFVNYLWPNFTHRGFITLIAAIIVYTVLVFVLIRRSIPRDLRTRLIQCGVPICMKCGYALRGLPTDRTRCPECGRAITPAARKLLDPNST